MSSGAPIEFIIQGNSEDYLDLFNTILCVRVKIILSSSENIPAYAEVDPVKYYLYSLILQIDASLNDMLITASGNTYASKENPRSHTELWRRRQENSHYLGSPVSRHSEFLRRQGNLIIIIAQRYDV